MLGYEPDRWQFEFIHSRGERYVAGCTCRQCGKSTGMAAEIHTAMTQRADQSGEPPLVGVMAVDFPRAEIPVMKWVEWYKRAFGGDSIHINLNEHFIRIKDTGAMIRWFSAESPLGAAGYTFSAFFFDESQWISNVAYVKTRPAFNARKARVFAFGTPDANEDSSWFRGLWNRGQDEDDTDAFSFRLDVFHNPHIDYDEIVAMRHDMTDDEFRMLALGQWVASTGRVFRRFKHCFTGEWQTKPLGGPYVMGMDVAKQHDYTVMYVLDRSSNDIVAKQRISGLPYDAVEDAAEEMYQHWNVTQLTMDSTGVGEPVADHLRKKGLNVKGFVFTNASKHQLVSNLNRMLEHGELTLPADDKQLVRELEVFEGKKSAAGNLQYSSPDSYFDDSIMALGLTALEARRRAAIRQSSYLGGRRKSQAPDWFQAIGRS